MKYSINSNGFIVAERDIYSLGGFIPKGSVGAKVANEDQISQDGECWVAGGDISARPDVRVKDNAYIGTFTPGANPVHTDGITEFSGNTIIPGNILVRSFVADAKNNFFAKDSFIGVSMDVLCGPATTTTAFPFGQGRLDYTKPAGTPMADAAVADENSCFSNEPLIIGKDTQVYVPSGIGARVLWAYRSNSNVVKYSGESKSLSQGLNKISHMSYGMCFLYFTTGAALNPERLLTLGAKILGHISRSVTVDIRPESTSGSYVVDKSSLLLTSDNFGLATTQQRLLAGGMYNTNMHTKTDVAAYKPYGTFRNVERLEYTKYLSDSHRTAATRDTYISAYDCPLLRVDNATYDDLLAAEGNLTLRGCIVPKAYFTHDVANGNTYEDIDFSYANEFIRSITSGRYLYSSHREGLYAYGSSGELIGLISYPGNMADTAKITEAHDTIMLGGNIIEQGTYYGALVHYEADKHDDTSRVRTKFPLPTRGAKLPVLPAGFGVHAIMYLDDNFVCKLPVTDPITIESTYPYYVMVFKRDNLNVALSAKDFIALGASLRSSNYTKVPEITGSAYVGEGCTVRGDVKLIGDPYINRIFDVNVWERGGVAYSAGKSWGEMRDGSNPGIRMSSKYIYPVSPGDTISLTGPYRLGIVYFNADKKAVHDTGWSTATFTVPDGCFYMGLSFSSSPDGKFIDFSDIPLANVKYVRAFKKRRYITNELDRTSPEDTLLAEDQWRVAAINTGEGSVGKLYKDLIVTSNRWCILKRPFNMGSSWTIQLGNSVTYAANPFSWDALTKLLGTGIKDGVALTGLELGKKNGYIVTLLDVPAARIVLEFVPSPRIVVPYGSSTLFISGPKIRMYDNAVLSRNLNQEGEIVLSGEAVMGYDFNAGSCMCSNGHSDAILKLP